MRWTVVAVVLVITLATSTVVVAADGNIGVIEGQVVNKSADGGSMSNQDVMLETYINDTLSTETKVTQTDGDGNFRFSDLSTDTGSVYFATIYYQGAYYFSEAISFDEGKKTKIIAIDVFESTETDAAIALPLAHTIIYPEQGRLYVMEYSVFHNESDCTYIGVEGDEVEGINETLRFSLPTRATEVELSDGLSEYSVIVAEGGFVDTVPVYPGTKEVVYYYTIDPGDDTYTFTKALGYPTKKYELLVQDQGITVECSQLNVEVPMEMDGERFIHFSGDELDPDTVLMVDFSELSTSSNQSAGIWLVFASVIGAAAVVFGYVLVSKRKVKHAGSELRDSDQNINEDRQQLLLEIAQLDDDHQLGVVPEDIYQQVRAQKKAELVRLLERLQ